MGNQRVKVLHFYSVCMSALTPLSAFHSAEGGDLPWTVVSYLLRTSLVDVDLTVFAP